MSEEEWDPFKLTSGLPLSGATVECTSMEFGYDAQYGADNCVVIIGFQPDEGDPATQLYSVGKHFEPGDRGASLQHKSGKPTNLNDNSNYGRFVDSFTGMEGAADAMAETRSRKSSPFQADWLVGMRFKLGDRPWINTMEKDPEKQKRNLIVPVEYLGTVANGEPLKKTTGAKKLAPKPGSSGSGGKTIAEATADDKAAADDSDADETFGVDDPVLLKKLIKLAKANTDWDVFSDAALEFDEVAADKALQKVVMGSKPGSLWATHGGG